MRPKKSGRTWNLLVRGDCSEAAAACEMNENTLNLSIARPGLEDIYIALAAGPSEDVPVASAGTRVTV